MITTNLFKQLQSLQSTAPMLTGEITADLGAGLVQVTQPGGGVQPVRNTPGLAMGQWVFFRAGLVIGEAPNLPAVRIEI